MHLRHLILIIVYMYDKIQEIFAMAKRKEGLMQNEYIDRMIKNLPVLRTAINPTLAQLEEKLSVNR